jgi:cytoskeletal protein CcmA (bactofilin family)
MDKKATRNLFLSGIGTASGGDYDEVRIDGVGKINGDIDCGNLVFNGSGEIRGSVRAEVLEVRGSAVILQDVRSERAAVQGKIRIKGGLCTEEIDIQGQLSVGGDCQAESITGQGVIAVGGLLNAESIEMTLYGHSRVKEIGGGTIRITNGRAGFGLLHKFLPPFTRLTADTIEGDEVYLESTRAKVVRGREVTIGPGCEIERIEYQTGFRQDKDAKVKSHQQIGWEG